MEIIDTSTQKQNKNELNSFINNKLEQGRYNKTSIVLCIKSFNNEHQITEKNVIDYYSNNVFSFLVDYWMIATFQLENGDKWYRILLYRQKRFDVRKQDSFAMKYQNVLYETYLDEKFSEISNIKLQIKLFYQIHSDNSIQKLDTGNQKFWYNPDQDDKSLINAEILFQHGKITKEQIYNNPSLLFRNKQNIEKLCSEIDNQEKEKEPFKQNYIFPQFILGGKKRHVWLFGPSSMGKSTLIQYYIKKNNVKIAKGKQEGFWDPNLNDPECGTIVFEEFTGKGWTNQQLNKIMDGNFMANPKIKPTIDVSPQNKIVQCIFISEKPPQEVNYKLASKLSFVNRVHPLSIYKVHKIGINLKQIIEEFYQEQNEKIDKNAEIFQYFDFEQYQNINDIPNGKISLGSMVKDVMPKEFPRGKIFIAQK